MCTNTKPHQDRLVMGSAVLALEPILSIVTRLVKRLRIQALYLLHPLRFSMKTPAKYDAITPTLRSGRAPHRKQDNSLPLKRYPAVGKKRRQQGRKTSETLQRCGRRLQNPLPSPPRSLRGPVNEGARARWPDAHHGQRIDSLWGIQELYQTADGKATVPRFNNSLCGISQARKPDGIAQPPGWVSLPSSGRSCQIFYYDRPEWCTSCVHTADAPHPTKDCRRQHQERRRALRSIRRLLCRTAATSVSASTAAVAVPAAQQAIGPPAPLAAEDVEMSENTGQQSSALDLSTGAFAGLTPLRESRSAHEVWHYLNHVRVPAGFCRFPVDSTNPISLATPQAKTAARMTFDAQLRNVGLTSFEVTLNNQSNTLRSVDIRLLPPVTDFQRLALRSSQLQLQGARLSFALEGREIPPGCTFFNISDVSAATLEKPHQLFTSLDGQFAHHGQRIEALC
ncbi:hypothetical protein IE81DRAFT_328776 [Ceraceosorus guamensis]|uniref:Uncharacterized protein n=1 Tax=Ceraceosorus guamensis TaxID=1522189 RepID=A0A316W9U7_9BASI|nr:hypothetical protein IE81DRAFT_328776 [Ceraceosorus guamensis]PWN44425.1 hypothetical protein IE81DRAFT_328776 [Ceraceosorus guamensis]